MALVGVTTGQGQADDTLLTLNGGSSSLKFALHDAASDRPALLLDGQLTPADPRSGLRQISESLQRLQLCPPSVIAHRVVHSGPDLTQHCQLDDEVLVKIDAASALAPLHNAAAIDIMCAAATTFPNALHVACFDTVFHMTMPEEARRLPISAPADCAELRRYGFHGLSCESIVHQLASELPERLIVAHLGHGASLSAVRSGRSIGNTMGLTPTGGLLMATRSGDLDPGVLVYLMREHHYQAAQLDTLLTHHSGLLGVSGTSSNLQALREAARTDSRASLAVRMFCQSVARGIAGMIAMLDGVDMIVFTGGIGENDAATRIEVCAPLAWMGIRLDPTRSPGPDGAAEARDSRCAIRVLPSLENEQMARHARTVVSRCPAVRSARQAQHSETSVT